MIKLRQHSSSSYAPRTKENASRGVTLAYAVDHNTAGERCTQRAAAGRIVKVTPEQMIADPAGVTRRIVNMLAKHKCRTLNVAGNGIYTWEAHGYDQNDVNWTVYAILLKVTEYYPLDLVVSGGQTGSDIAGILAAANLGIPAEGLWPKGYKMRFADGVDRNHTEAEIMEILNEHAV